MSQTDARRIMEESFVRAVFTEYDRSADEALKYLVEVVQPGIRKKLETLSEEAIGNLPLAQQMLDAIAGIKGYLERAYAEFLKDIDGKSGRKPAVPQPETSPRRRTTTPRRYEAGEFNEAELVDALGTLSRQEPYQARGVRARDIADYLHKTPMTSGPIGMNLKKMHGHGLLAGYEYRDGAWFSADGKDSVQAEAPHYRVPLSKSLVGRLDRSRILRELYETGQFEVPRDFVYDHQNGPRAVSEVLDDLRTFLRQAGYKGEEDVDANWQRGVITMPKGLRTPFNHIVDLIVEEKKSARRK